MRDSTNNEWPGNIADILWNAYCNKKMECEDLREEVERLQRIIDSRPAINAGLPDTYINWSQSIVQTEIYKSIFNDELK